MAKGVAKTIFVSLGIAPRTFIALLVVLVGGCSEKEPSTKSTPTHAFKIVGMCQDIHIKQPFEYKGKVSVSTVNSKYRAQPFRLTSGYMRRDIESGELGREAVAQAQDPRLYRPPFSIGFWIENDEIINAKQPFMMSGKAGGKDSGDNEAIMDCSVTITGDAPLPK
jgi:hypothetical protein